MRRLSGCRHSIRYVTLAVAGAVLLMGGVASSAWAKSSFNCENASETKAKTCLIINGPNEMFQEGEGNDYTYPEFYLTFYKYNGGSSYTVIYETTAHEYSFAHCYTGEGGNFDGHERVAVTALEYSNLAGTQRACP